MGILNRREVRVGSVMGVLLAGILVLNAFGIYYLNTGGEITVIPCLIAYFYAGYRTRQNGGTMRAGALAGFLTGLISSFLNIFANLFVVFTHLDSIRERVQAESVAAHQLIHYTNEQIFTQRILGVVAGLVLASFVATAVGMLGARIGCKRGKV